MDLFELEETRMGHPVRRHQSIHQEVVVVVDTLRFEIATKGEVELVGAARHRPPQTLVGPSPQIKPP